MPRSRCHRISVQAGRHIWQAGTGGHDAGQKHEAVHNVDVDAGEIIVGLAEHPRLDRNGGGGIVEALGEGVRRSDRAGRARADGENGQGGED